MREENAARAVMAHTPLGTIFATRTNDSEHPGIWLDLRLPQSDVEIPLGLVEYSADETDLPEGKGYIITRVWGDAEDENYTDRIVHKGIEEHFGFKEVEKA